jgi:DNA-binding transcriptional regulator LsrR (DeoR family)
MAGQGADQAEIASELGIERKTVVSLLDLADYWASRLV